MRLAIHQPNYLPYIGFFHKIHISDVFVILDTVQFVKSGPLAWMNRNKIRTAQGSSWLTVPVLTRGKFPVIIKEALIDNTQDWRRKHLNSLNLNYHKAEYFHRYYGFLDQLYKKEWLNLSELNVEIIQYLLKQLNIGTKIIKASDLDVKGESSDLLVNICKQVGAKEYVYGKHGEDYMELEKFEKNGIKTIAQNFSHPVYKQAYEPFMENMSVVDLLFNEGENSINILSHND
ncbi:MAG: WbqC family protein [Candidatus Omnitrophota bacterium]